jgi:spermidine/putrescine transport system permease protein
VTLPLLTPAIVVAALFSFSFSFDDLVTSQFLSGTGTETIPMLLYGLIRFQVTPEVNAIGAGIMVLTTTTLLTATLIAVAARNPGFGRGLRRQTQTTEGS